MIIHAGRVTLLRPQSRRKEAKDDQYANISKTIN